LLRCVRRSVRSLREKLGNEKFHQREIHALVAVALDGDQMVQLLVEQVGDIGLRDDARSVRVACHTGAMKFNRRAFFALVAAAFAPKRKLDLSRRAFGGTGSFFNPKANVAAQWAAGQRNVAAEWAADQMENWLVWPVQETLRQGICLKPGDRLVNAGVNAIWTHDALMASFAEEFKFAGLAPGDTIYVKRPARLVAGYGHSGQTSTPSPLTSSQVQPASRAA